MAHLGYKLRPMMLSKTFWLVNYGVEIGTFYVLYLAQKHFGLSRLFISAGYFDIWHVKCPKKVDRMKGVYILLGFVMNTFVLLEMFWVGNMK